MPELSTLPIEGEQLVDASVTYEKLEALAGAAPAAPGQVLTAVDADTAVWQAPAAAPVPGAGLAQSGSTVNVVAADGSIQVNPDSINVRLDPVGSLAVSGAGVRVLASDASITIAGTGVALGAAAAGNGLTKSGAALNVVAANASIVVGADNVGVGVLQSDAMHGARGGGTQHALVTQTADGFMADHMVSHINQNAAKGYRSRLPVAAPDIGATNGFVLENDTIYWVYIGRANVDVSVKWIAVYIVQVGAGSQTCDMVVGTTASAPDGASWLVTCRHVFGPPPAFTQIASKRSTGAPSITIAAGSFMWLGIRCHMTTTLPTTSRLVADNYMGTLLRTVGDSSPLAPGSVFVGDVGSGGLAFDGPDLACMLV